MKLYTYKGNKNAYKALIAAEYVGAKIEVPEFKMGVDNKTPEFLKKNPHGKVPVLETDKGCVFESNAIARYVARLSDVGLFGSNQQETALVEQWIDFVTNEIDAPLISWCLPLMGVWPYDKKKEQGAITAVKTAMAVLNDHFLEHTVLVGETITLADIVAVCCLYHGFTKLFDGAFRAPFANVERYFVTMVNQPQFKKIIGDVVLCTEPLKYTPPKKEAKKEKAKPAEAAKPAEEKPKKEEKAKPWYDLLPPSKMQMDGWKRLYSNSPANDFRNVCITRLWEGGPVPASQTDEVFPGYDHDGYSMWFCEYKYPEENTVNFMVMNKINGFLQRVDFARKYAFSVMCILKDSEGRFPVKGVWMFRGPDIPQQMLDESYDLELFTMTKVDLSDAAQKKTVEDMICEEAVIDGLECVDCKIFK